MTEKEESRELIRRAFNAGCNARLAGDSVLANPYVKVGGNGSLWTAWRNGWHDVNHFWGKASLRPVQPLPRIRA